MRGLDQLGRVNVAGTQPKGLAFDITDLLHARSLAVAHDRRMRIRLDHGTDDEEYEEVIEFLAGPQSRSRAIIWRNAEAVFVQPLPGRQKRYCSMREALCDLFAPQRDVAVSEIAATTRPNSA